MKALLDHDSEDHESTEYTRIFVFENFDHDLLAAESRQRLGIFDLEPRG